MNKSLGFELLSYSILLTGLSYIVHHTAPAMARPTLIAGMTGGALCLVWSLFAILGRGGKALPVLTLVPVCYVMLWQAVVAWLGRNAGGTENQLVPIPITVALVLTVAMLIKIIHAGVASDGRTSVSANEKPDKTAAPAKPEGHANRRDEA
jgi:hypothetical protein